MGSFVVNMKKYVVQSWMNWGRVDKAFSTDSPKTALNKYFSYSETNRSMVCINCGRKEDCLALYKCFLENVEEFKQKYWVKGKLDPVYFDYIYNACVKYTNGEIKLIFNSKGYYSQVPHFWFRSWLMGDSKKGN